MSSGLASRFVASIWRLSESTEPRGSRKEPALYDVFLTSVHDIQERQSYRDVSYSHIYDGRYELLDHIFVSDEFVGSKTPTGRVLGTRIFNDHIFDSRLAAYPEGPKRRIRSDHGVPVTEVLLKAPVPPPTP